MRSLFERLDPRTRVVTVVTATVIVASAPAPGGALAWYMLPISTMALTSRTSAADFSWRLLAASPFIVLASALLAVQAGYLAGLIVAVKAFEAIMLLTILTSTTPLGDLLWALRRLHVPESLSLILGMMHRYTSLLSAEYARMARARDSRTVQTLGRLGFAAHGGHIGTLMLRSWDRAERVHDAMLARGFTGAWPSLATRELRAIDGFYLAVVMLLFLAARLLG